MVPTCKLWKNLLPVRGSPGIWAWLSSPLLSGSLFSLLNLVLFPSSTLPVLCHSLDALIIGCLCISCLCRVHSHLLWQPLPSPFPFCRPQPVLGLIPEGVTVGITRSLCSGLTLPALGTSSRLHHMEQSRC